MKKYILQLTDWRTVAVTLMAMLAFYLIAADCDGMTLFLTLKAAGAATGYAAVRLANRWQGRMPVLEMFNDNEEED